MVAVAQLVESRIVIPVVVGSSPISHPSTLIMLTAPPAVEMARRGITPTTEESIALPAQQQEARAGYCGKL